MCGDAPAVVSVDLTTFGDDVAGLDRTTTRLCGECAEWVVPS
jgi:hypothetical protein